MIPLRRSDPFGGPRPLYATCDAGLEPLLAEGGFSYSKK